MLRKSALFFGLVFIILGLAGLVSEFVGGADRLFGLFQLNIVFALGLLLTGLASLLVIRSKEYALWYFQVLGIVYAVLTVLGFIYMTDSIFGLIANNMANNILYLATTIIALYLGYSWSEPAAE